MPDPEVLKSPVFHVEHHQQLGGKLSTRLLTPDMILGSRVHNEQQLGEELARYSSGVITWFAPTISERRFYIERVRPALRWYCRAMGVQMPAWLQGNGPADGLTVAAHTRLFGPQPLKVQEFKSWGEAIQEKGGGK